jgi:replicative superfamily II helicase
MSDITKAEHENMGGRAGRLGFVNEFGRGILVTSSPFQKRRFTTVTSKVDSRNYALPLKTKT